jgi:hypothetical protein
MTQAITRDSEYKAYQDAFAEEDPKAEEDAPGDGGEQAAAPVVQADAPGVAERAVNESLGPDAIKHEADRASMQKVRASNMAKGKKK